MFGRWFLYPTMFLFLFFFFQAEDGIRDWSVTGVQTCALPILAVLGQSLPTFWRASRTPSRAPRASPSAAGASCQIGRASCRKECRSRWLPYHLNKKREVRYYGMCVITKQQYNVDWHSRAHIQA